MKRFLMASALSCGALLTLGISPASANVMYDWTLSGGPDVGSGQLTIDGANNIVSFSGVIDSFAVNLLGGQPGGQATSGDGLWYYDNILYPENNAASCAGGPTGGLLDTCGVLFSINGGSGNIWGNGSSPNTYSFGYNYGSGEPINGGETFTLVSAPEPGTLALIVAGLLSILGLGLKRRRSDA